MCRRFRILGAITLGFGAGLLAAGLFESEFFCGFVAVALLATGVFLMQKK